ncbi:MAG: ATP synthase subunit I [Deltaproteobacteria bacterium]
MGMPFTQLLQALALGLGCSALYFLGLWYTVHRIPSARRPTFLVLSSFFVRIGLLLPAIYWVMDGHLEGLVVCMLAFMLVRNLSARSVLKSVQRPFGEKS